jgi:hypothetical protein
LIEKLPENLRAALFDRNYLGGTESISEMENIILHDVQAILANPNLPLPEDDPEYKSLSTLLPVLYKGYEDVAKVDDIILEEDLAFVLVTCQAMFFACLGGLAIIFFGIFRPLLAGLRFEHEKTKRLLYQIPMEAAKQNYPLQILLRGKEAALDLFVQHEIVGMKFTKDGS